MSRAFSVLAVFSLALVNPQWFSSHARTPFTLQIESLSRLPLAIHVTATSPDLLGAALVTLDTLVSPGAAVPIADSITTVHVVVDRFGAVRATLTSQAGDSVVAEGRDLTFSRAPGGRFARVWKVQPLVP